ncbi:Replication factor-A carboxy-terminal domain protein [Arachis hypogaea]|nr:Replication factor-A carboxy-terminal domain protein [Arachis hypogaea]
MIEQGVKGTQPLFIANEGKVVSLKDDFMRLTRDVLLKSSKITMRRVLLSFSVQSEVLLKMEVGGILLMCEKGIYPQNGAYYCDFCVKHITNVTPKFKIKIILEDYSGKGIFVLFDREASYLFKKSCADLFTEVQKDASVDTKGVGFDKFFGTFRVRRVCDDSTIIAMFKLPDYDTDDESTPKKPDVSGGIEVAALINDENEKVEKTPKNDILSDDFSFELDILLSSPVKETQEVFSQVLNACSHYGEKVIHKDHVVTSKGKKNLNPQFDEAANDANGRGSNIAKVDGV